MTPSSPVADANEWAAPVFWSEAAGDWNALARMTQIHARNIEVALPQAGIRTRRRRHPRGMVLAVGAHTPGLLQLAWLYNETQPRASRIKRLISLHSGEGNVFEMLSALSVYSGSNFAEPHAADSLEGGTAREHGANEQHTGAESLHAELLWGEVPESGRALAIRFVQGAWSVHDVRKVRVSVQEPAEEGDRTALVFEVWVDGDAQRAAVLRSELNALRRAVERELHLSEIRGFVVLHWNAQSQ